MPDVLPSRTRSAKPYAALVLFIAVYLGVLGFVFAPKDLIAVQSGSVLVDND
jgi:hypothetical protein